MHVDIRKGDSRIILASVHSKLEELHSQRQPQWWWWWCGGGVGGACIGGGGDRFWLLSWSVMVVQVVMFIVVVRHHGWCGGVGSAKRGIRKWGMYMLVALQEM